MSLFTTDLLTDFEKKFSFDSHTHFFGVGLPATEFLIDKNASSLKLPEHLKNKVLIRGYGWSDQMPFTELDSLCEQHPGKFFCLSYVDGHKSFVSKNLITKLNFKKKQKKDSAASSLKHGAILSETERDDFYALLPSPSLKDLEKKALYAQNIFLKNKISKIRHLTGSPLHWSCLKNLKFEGLLKIQIDVFFSEFMGQTFNESIAALKSAQKENSKILKATGLKIFYDGSLSSKTAYVSSDKTSTARITKDELFKKMKTSLCEHDFPLAVHTIGDLALKDCLELYKDLSSKKADIPKLHLEHAPIFSNSSLQLLRKNKLNCTFHFQPSHWIDDQGWYDKNKNLLGTHKIYPFRFLEENNYTYHLGSDAPVMDPTRENMIRGLKFIEASIEDSSAGLSS